MTVIMQSSRRFYGWNLVVLLFFVMAINTAMPIYGLAILNVHMGDELGFSRATLGGAFAVYMLMTGLPGPIAARLIDKSGVRRTLAIGNTILLIGALAMATIVRTPALFVVFAGCAIGAASGIGGPVPIQALVTRWFARRRALAMGIVMSGGSAAGVVCPPLFERIVAVGGWRAGWWLIAGFAAAIIACVLLFVRERPEDLHQQADGGALSEDHEAQAALLPPRVYQTHQDWSFRDVLITPAFWLLMVCSIGVSGVYTIFYAQSVLQIRDLGYSAQAGSYLLSVAVGVGFAAHLAISLLGDRVDPKVLWAGALFLQGLGIGLFAHADQPWRLYVAIACLGVGNAASILCLIMTMGNWFGERASPFVFGFGSAFSATCGALAPVASGYCYDRIGTFAPVFYAMSVFCLAAAGALWLLRPPRLAAPAAICGL